MIIFFSYFYTAVVFNPQETAENLKKYGGFIPGIRPGNNTADYFDRILTRLTTIGALYLCVVCLLPEVLIANYNVPFYFRRHQPDDYRLCDHGHRDASSIPSAGPSV